MKKRVIAGVSLCLFLAACGDRATNIVAAMPLVASYSPQYKASMSVGEITGGSSDNFLLGSEGITKDQFKNILEKALAANGMLSQPVALATYKISADVTPGMPSFPVGDDNLITEEVHYKVTKNADNSVVYDQVIKTAAPGPSLSWKTMLLSSPSQVSMQRSGAFSKAISDNVVQFMGSLKQ